MYDNRTGYKLKHFKEGKESMRFHFYVRNLDDPDQLKYGPDEEFLLAKTRAVPILRELLAGHYDLEITRHGRPGSIDTRYEVKPILPQAVAA